MFSYFETEPVIFLLCLMSSNSKSPTPYFGLQDFDITKDHYPIFE